MKEYRLISLDRFDGINLESTVYMLSHNHSGRNIRFYTLTFNLSVLCYTVSVRMASRVTATCALYGCTWLGLGLGSGLGL